MLIGLALAALPLLVTLIALGASCLVAGLLAGLVLHSLQGRMPILGIQTPYKSALIGTGIGVVMQEALTIAFTMLTMILIPMFQLNRTMGPEVGLRVLHLIPSPPLAVLVACLIVFSRRFKLANGASIGYVRAVPLAAIPAISMLLVFVAASVALKSDGYKTILKSDDHNTIEWKQEARLHDGRVITIDRVSEQTAPRLPGNVVFEYEQTLTFTHPESGERIQWVLPKGAGAWMLDFDGDVAYYVLRAKSGADYNEWRCPNPAWIVYKHKGDHWTRIPLDDLPAHFDKPNLLPEAASDKQALADRYVGVEEMDAFFPRQVPVFRAISRDKINPLTLGCYRSVLKEQGGA